jgi:hypothetical protein
MPTRPASSRPALLTSCQQTMDPLWSPVVANGGNQRQIHAIPNRKNKPNRCTRCHRLRRAVHGKQGVCRGLPPVAEGPLLLRRGRVADARTVGQASGWAARVTAAPLCDVCYTRARVYVLVRQDGTEAAREVWREHARARQRLITPPAARRLGSVESGDAHVCACVIRGEPRDHVQCDAPRLCGIPSKWNIEHQLIVSEEDAALTSIGSRECDESIHLARGPNF